jgi:hypothetical protein
MEEIPSPIPSPHYPAKIQVKEICSKSLISSHLRLRPIIPKKSIMKREST